MEKAQADVNRSSTGSHPANRPQFTEATEHGLPIPFQKGLRSQPRRMTVEIKGLKV